MPRNEPCSFRAHQQKNGCMMTRGQNILVGVQERRGSPNSARKPENNIGLGEHLRKGAAAEVETTSPCATSQSFTLKVGSTEHIGLGSPWSVFGTPCP